MPRFPAALALLLAFTATARAQTAADLPDPCSLVTPADVETALGRGATTTKRHNPRTGADECVLTGTGAVTEIIIVVRRADLFEATKKQLIASGTGVQEVKGLGDDAYSGRTVGYNVRKGRLCVQVFGTLLNRDDAANDKATRSLAERAASRL